VTQQEHLTTEQLSAFLDKQLTPQEQAFFDAHLQSCQRCQHVLAELRGTVALLRAMPEPPLPRSFTLPAGISQTPAARPQSLPLPARQRRVPRYMLQRTVRAVSTLAAVIAVIFILSGILAGLPPRGGVTASSGVVPAASSGNAPIHPTTGHTLTQAPQARPSTPVMAGHQSSTPAKSPMASTPAPTPAPTSNGTNQVAPPTPPTLPPFLDIGQPSGRLLLGAFLLLLSIVGFIATRRRRRAVI
jgi:hypothetical protein